MMISHRLTTQILILLISLLNHCSGAAVNGSDGTLFTWVTVVLVLTVIGLLTVLIIEIIILYKIARLGGVPLRSVWLGQLLLFAILISYITLIIFVFEPTPVTCNLLRFTIGFCYCFILALLLVKVLVVLSPKTHPGFIKLGHQIMVLLMLLCVQIIINVQWIILKPTTSTISIDGRKLCPSTSNWAFSTILYDFLLSFIFLAIIGAALIILTLWGYVKSRRREGKPNSEARWILLTCIVTAATWLVWILVAALLPGADMAALAIGLWVTATATLIIMFVPKLHKLATLKDGEVLDETPYITEEFYYEDELPGLVSYNVTGSDHPDGIEMTPPTIGVDQNGSIIAPPSYQAESVLYAPSDVGDERFHTIERAPSVILEEKSNMSNMSSVGPSPSVIYKRDNMDRVHFQNDPNALELQHPTSRSHAPRQNYTTLSQVDNLSDYSAPPTQRYYTVGGHGRRHKGPASVIGVPRYERRYHQQTMPLQVYHPEPQYVYEVAPGSGQYQVLRGAGVHHPVAHHRYAGSSSGSGLDSPRHIPSGSASVIGIPRYEGPMAKRYMNGYTNAAFTVDDRRRQPPVQYVEVPSPKKAASVVGVPRYEQKTVRIADDRHMEQHRLSPQRKTLSQQDLSGGGGLTPITPVHQHQHRNGHHLSVGTLPRNAKLVYKPASNGRLMPTEQRQRAFSDDMLERSSVY